MAAQDPSRSAGAQKDGERDKEYWMRVDVTQPGKTGKGPQPQPGRRRTPGVPGPRRGQPAGPFSAVRLAFMRLTRGWELLLAVGVGILVAVILICTVPLYNSLVANIQLER